MNDEVLPLLKVHEYFRGVSDEAMQEVARQAKVVNFAAASVVHEANVVLTDVGFVLRGRLKAIRVDSRGNESLFRMIERGEQYGMMVGALAEPVPIRVVALEPTTVLSLKFEQAIELTQRFPELRRIWLTTFAGSLHKHFFGAPTRRAPMLLALIHHSPTTQVAAQKLVARLTELGEKLAILGDRDEWRKLPNIQFRHLHVDGRMLDVDEIRRQVSLWQAANRIIFDISEKLGPDLARRLMASVDRVVYFVPAVTADDALERLRAVAEAEHGWRDKISVAWLLDGDKPVAPSISNLPEFASRDFKIADTPLGSPWGRSLAAGLERLVHDLRGVRIGLALSGGAARGMAHLGVLKALDECGIIPDMVAGTSAGAMTGIVYSSGFDPAFCTERFAEDLRPGWIFRRLPHGNHWYLLYKYRTGQFDPMLRKYLRDRRLEQLPIPCFSVTVDLVGASAVVRERGDAVHAICESINIPGISIPICRGGQALIDGGLVNNIPADVLVSKGCNFVIAASVTGKIEKRFSDITPDGPMPKRAKPSIVSTLLRTFAVQNHCLNTSGIRSADVVIDQDVTKFDLAEFVRTKELAAVGEAAALEQIPKIRQLLNRLDPQLFKRSDDVPQTESVTNYRQVEPGRQVTHDPLVTG
jgi:predicted acylesterase/phospholipase RssA/CRP-like cAMP-binding protein